MRRRAQDETNQAGEDPLELRSRAAVTEPFTDFAAESIVRLSLTRMYSSADDSVRRGMASGPFGRGWRDEWQSEQSCMWRKNPPDGPVRLGV